MTESIGSVSVDVVPNAERFVADFRARVLPGMSRLGGEAGEAFVRAFREPVERDLPQVFPRARQRTNEQSRQSGKQAGDAFGRELDTRITAAIKALPDIEIDADSRDIDEKLFIIRQQLTELSGKDIDVDLSAKDVVAGLAVLRAQLDELSGPDHDVRVRINAAAASAELAALSAQIAALDEQAEHVGTRAASGGNLLGAAVAGLVPLIGPLATLGIAGLGAFAAGAVTAGLAVKGVNDEIKDGTELGKQWQASLHGLAGDLTIVETTASRAFKGGFDAAAADLQERMPAITGEVQRLGTETADIAQHGLAAMFAGFTALDPLIEQFLGDIDRGAQKLQGWADGGGLNGFVSWARTNLPDIEHDLALIVGFVGKFLAAEAPEGVAILDVLGELAKLGSDVLEVIGPIVPLLTDVYLAMQLYKGLGAATASLRAFAAAEAAAGTAGAAGAAGGAAAGAAGILGRARPYAAGALIFALAATEASKATDKWTYSNNGFVRSTHEAFKAGSDLVHLDFGGFWDNLSGTGSDEESKYRRFKSKVDDIRDLRRQLATENTVQARPGIGLGSFAVPETPGLDAFSRERSAAFADSVNDITKSFRYLHQQIASEPLSQASEQWNSLQTQIQASVDQTDKFLKLGGPVVTTINGLAIGEKTWDAALAQSGGDKAAALGLLQGLSEGMDKNRHRINQLITDQVRLGQFQADMTTKWKLSADQLDIYSEALGLSAGKIAKTPLALKLAEQELGDFIGLLRNGDTATQGWVAAIDEFNKAGDSVGSRAKLISAALVAEGGDLLAYSSALTQATQARFGLLDAFKSEASQLAQQTAAQDKAANSAASAQNRLDTANGRVAAAEAKLSGVRSSAKATNAQVAAAEQAVTSARNAAASSANSLANAQIGANNGTALSFRDTELAAINLKTGLIDLNAKGAAPLIQQLQGIQTDTANASAAIYQHETALHKASAADDAFNYYVQQTRGFLVDNADQLGLTAGQAGKLADQYFGLENADDVKKEIELIGKDRVSDAITDLTKQIAGFGDTIAEAFVGLRGFPEASDSLDVLISKLNYFNRTHTATVVIGEGTTGGGHTGDDKRIAHGGILQFAGGGVSEAHLPMIDRASAGTVRIWREPETDWEAYIPGADDWRRPRAKEITQEVVKRLGGVALFSDGRGGVSADDLAGIANAHASVPRRVAPANGRQSKRIADSVHVHNTWNYVPAGRPVPTPADVRRGGLKLGR